MTSYQQPNIDFALEGLKNPLDGLRAADEAARLTDFSVDLVELDRIDDAMLTPFEKMESSSMKENSPELSRSVLIGIVWKSFLREPREFIHFSCGIFRCL